MNHCHTVIATVALSLSFWTILPSAAGIRDLSIDCGKAQATLQCKPKSTNCTQTTLRLRKSDGSSLRLSKTKGMERYTGVGFSCVQARDSTPYLVVQFGELPEGCQFCEWLHVHTLQGKFLTNSQPPILRDESRPEASALAPNNKEFNALSKQLGLQRLKLEFVK